MQLEGRLALVTGAGSGLGLEIALGLARRGAAVVVVDRDASTAESGAAAVGRVGVDAWSVVADVRDAEAVVDAVSRLGEISVLVNNAGAWTPGEQYPGSAPDAWRATVELNLLAPMRLTQAFLDPMRRAGGGVVVNIASSAALGDGAYGSPEYAASKAGLVRFTTSLAGLPATHGVRAVCVVPDWIGLPRAVAQRAAMTSEEREDTPSLIPPEDVVAAVLDLVDDDAASGTVVSLFGDGH